MRVLIIKTSSFGDVVHTLPAVSDAVAAIPDIRLDWVIEPDFAPIARLHPAIDRVIPLSMRALRKQGAGGVASFLASVRAVRERRYDAVIDAQGLLKSAPLALLARGPSHGLDRASAREPLASLAYSRRHEIARGEQAIERTRRLFAAALAYEYRPTPPDFGLREYQPGGSAPPEIVFVHATSWESKLWSPAHWRELAERLSSRGFRLALPAHGETERRRARDIAHGIATAEVLPEMDLAALAKRLAQASGAVALDTGLAHLLAALGIPVITLYGATSAGLTGTVGRATRNIAAPPAACALSPCLRRHCQIVAAGAPSPCLAAIEPATVADHLMALMEPHLAPSPPPPANLPGDDDHSSRQR